MILTKEQAAAVYRAMTELNNVGGRIHARMLTRDNFKHVKEYIAGDIQVIIGDAIGNCKGSVEDYANQDAFATAYGVK